MVQTQIVQPVAQSSRKVRHPQHKWFVGHYPWELAVMAIAPVLPGETLVNLNWQARAITDPILSRFSGWWLEYYWFYVKHRDLIDISDELVNMMLDPEWNAVSAGVATTSDSTRGYFEGGSTGHINWVKRCRERIVNTYFREAGETEASHTIKSGLTAVAIEGNNWMQSMLPAASYTPLTDVDMDLDASGDITVDEMLRAQQQYEFLRRNYGVELTYEDFLRSYGVSIAQKQEEHVPELLRFTRQWQMPTSVITQGTGAAASAVIWDVTERADKDRFFKEPGFIVGLTCARPKVFMANQKGHAASLLDNAYAWLPAVLEGQNDRHSWKNIPDNDMFGDVTDAGGAWVDLRDLFMYGDQFVNVSLASTGQNLVALPDAGLNRLYLADVDINGLFAGSTDGSRLIKQDGIASISIRSRLRDESGGTP